MREKWIGKEQRVSNRIPKRGDIFFVVGGCSVGHEQQSWRPAVVVSNDTANYHSMVVEVVYLTSSQKEQAPTHTEINSARVQSTALCEQITTVDKSRLREYMGRVTDDEINRIDTAIIKSLELDRKDCLEMEVKITSTLGENKFEIADNKVPALLNYAFKLTQDDFVPQSARPVLFRKDTGASDRRDTMFGSDWRDKKVADKTSLNNNYTQESGRKGFLLIECPDCKKRIGFNAKNRMNQYRCRCGGIAPLDNAVPAFLKCKCGASFKYMTNITAREFEYTCLSCGNPVDLEINKRETAYVTVGG